MATVAYLKRDRVEKFNGKRGWWATAWRLVDDKDRDLVQPWFEGYGGKSAAKAYAAERGWTVKES